MGSQWVKDLLKMADAIRVTAEEADLRGEPCRFCGARDGVHASSCPVALANRVIYQATDKLDS